MKALYGFIPNSLAVMAESPPALKAYLALGALGGETGFTEEERFIVMLTVSRENECPYCIPAVSTLGKTQGVSTELIRRIRQGQPLDSPKLEGLRVFTQKMVRNNGWVDDKDVSAFLDYGYSNRRLFEAILIMSMKLIAICGNHMMGIELDEAFQPERWTKVA